MTEGLIGKDAPLFQMNAVMPNLTYETVSLQDHIQEKKWTMLMFYPFDFCTISRSDLVQLSERIGKFEALQTKVLGISADSVYAHREFMKQSEIDFPLASDVSGQVASNYGCLNQDYRRFHKTLYFINEKGILVFIQHMPDIFSIDGADVLWLLQKIRSSFDTNGYVY